MSTKSIIAPDAYTAWLDVLRNLEECWEFLVSPRGHTTREVLGIRVEIENWRNNLIYHPERGLNYRFAVAEWLWVLLGLDDVSTLMRYNKQMSRFTDDGVKLAGAYGPRLKPQWSYILDTLRKDHDTRQAVATIFTAMPNPSKDVPCTVSLQFILRDGPRRYWTGTNVELPRYKQLHLVVTMRSSDAWLGLPYDIYTFSQLANVVAGELSHAGVYLGHGVQAINFDLAYVAPGSIILNLGSSHLYDDNLAQAQRVLAATDVGRTISSPLIPGFPRQSNVEPLTHALRGEPYRGEIYAPYARYCQALRADTWAAAREILEEGDCDHENGRDSVSSLTGRSRDGSQEDGSRG